MAETAARTFRVSTVSEYDVVYDWLNTFWGQPMVICLNGPMGVGKTTFVRGWLDYLRSKHAKSLSGDNPVSSPTYAIHQTYLVAGQTIDHFDLYRLQNYDELENSGFWECLADIDGWMIVEWADRVVDLQSHITCRYCVIDLKLAENSARSVHAACFLPK